MSTPPFLTLEDYFAANAMQAIIVASGGPAFDWDWVSRHAYQAAQSMLKEKERLHWERSGRS